MRRWTSDDCNRPRDMCRGWCRGRFFRTPNGCGSAEPRFARAGFAVCSNSSPYRMAADVPLLIPEVNPASVRPMVAVQRRRWQQQRPLLGQS